MTVYIDIVFVANVISSLLLFYSVDFIFSLKGRWYRILLSSIICGIYAVTDAIYVLYKPLRIVVLFFMILEAWGYKGALYNLLRVAFLEGIIAVAVTLISGLIGINALFFESGITFIAKDWVTAIITVIAYPVIMLINQFKNRKKRILRVIFTIDGEEIKLNLLFDSGNLLCHKNIPVAVIDWRNFPHIHSYEEILLTAPERLMYNTVSSSGIMPLIKPQNMLLGGVKRECYIGLTNKRFVGYAGVIGKIS